MAKETKAQKETVERVMHEFKHGELKTAGGRKVSNPRQAIAIGLSEAGASNQQTPEQNRKRLKKTKSDERQERTGEAEAVGGDRTKADLYDEARRRRVPGRSKMDKAELTRALDR
jgi:hypothetical protein